MSTNIQFDENGHALSTGVMTVHGYDPATGIYTGSYEAQIVAGYGIPGDSTTVALPTLQQSQAAIFQSGGWTVVEDHRGATVWNKSDGSRAEITAVGPLPDTVTTVEPPAALMRWDASTSSWVADTAARQAALRNQAAAALQVARASVQNNYALLNEPTPEAWVTYLRALMAIQSGTDTTSTTLPIAPVS